MESQRSLFLKHLAPTSPFPLMLEIERAEGVYLYDPNGKAYLDLISGIGVSSIGHRNPEVVKAIKDQADRYLHTMVYGEYVLAPQVELAELMAENLPDSLNSIYFVNSGSEATEGAMKLAKKATARGQILACKHAYHGSTQGAASLMYPTEFTQAFHPLLPGIDHIEYNEEEDLKKITHHTAAVIMETVQAEWGIRPPKDNYLKKVRQRCDETGTLLILDEIQAGYGRTGSLWAFEQYDIVPDILLLAKGMGGGMPIGAFVADKALMTELSDRPILGHITTFGGHPINCAAAHATLKTILREKPYEQVAEKEALFHSLLKHPDILEIRSAGLMMAVQMESFERIQHVIKHCMEEGLIIDWFLFNSTSLRIAPPLIIQKEQIRKACDIILRSIEKTKK